MKKKLIALILVILAVGVYYLASQKPVPIKVNDNEAQIILFYGDGCPHCKIVEQYIADNKIDSKVIIAYKEVYYNKTNQNLLEETAKKCPEIDTTQGIGVPFAYIKAENKCLLGDKPITDWLAKQ
jgi:glutaredoxin